MGKRRLLYFSVKWSVIIPLVRIFSVFICCAVWLRQVGKWGHREIFGKIWGNCPNLSRNRGARQRIQSRDIKITPYLQLTVTYSPVCYVTQYSFVQNFRRFGKLYIFGNLRTYWTWQTMFNFLQASYGSHLWFSKWWLFFWNPAISQLLIILDTWFWCLHIHFRGQRIQWDNL